MEIINQKEQKAKKKHRCDFCTGIIEIGEVYDYSFIANGGTYTWRSHLACMRLTSILKMEDDGEGIDTENFTESIKYEYEHLLNTKVLPAGEHIEKPTFEDKLQYVKNHYLKEAK